MGTALAASASRRAPCRLPLPLVPTPQAAAQYQGGALRAGTAAAAAGKQLRPHPTSRRTAADAPPHTHTLPPPLGAGIYVKPGRDRDALAAMLEKEGYVPVWLEPQLLDLYYNGFCNSVLWQLFHYVPLNMDGWQRMTEHHTMQMQWQVRLWTRHGRSVCSMSPA